MLAIYTDTRQLWIFVLYIALGIVLACLLHIVDCPLRTFCKIGWLRQICEGVAGVIEVVAVWLFNNVFNDGVYRLYIVVALVLGYILYYFMCKPTLDKVWKALYNLLVKNNVGGNNAKNTDK